MWYGMKDLGSELLGQSHENNGQLRKDEFWAMKDVSFELKRSECLGLIGRNGAGKTTLLRMLNGLIKPNKGRIEMHGRVGALIALGAGFNPILTGRENIYVNASVLGLSKKEIDAKFDEIVDFAELDEFIDAPVQSYSSGMNVRLGFAIATALKPDILLLDEVLAVGDAAFRFKCYRRINEVLKHATVIFVSHDLRQVLNICNVAVLLERGEMLKTGTPKDVANAYGKLLAEIDSSFLTGASEKSLIMDDKLNELSRSQTSNIEEFRYGSHDASIMQIKILDEDLKHSTTLIKGEKYTFEVDIAFHKYIQKPAIGVSIITLSGIEICGTSTLIDNYLVPSVNANSIIRTKFTQVINLNPGSYSLNVSVASILEDKRIFLDRRLDVIIFKVVGISKSYGFIDLNSEISIENIS